MTKEEYSEALKSPQWRKKRIAILNRDNQTCQSCRSNDNLHVHHIWYIDGKMPWEVPDDYLVTLCDLCHGKEHKNRKISSFIKYDKSARSKKTNKVEVKRKSKAKMSKDARKALIMIRSCISPEERQYLKANKLKYGVDLLTHPAFTSMVSKLKERLLPVKAPIYDILKRKVGIK